MTATFYSAKGEQLEEWFTMWSVATTLDTSDPAKSTSQFRALVAPKQTKYMQPRE